MKIILGTDFTFQHHRVLVDSSLMIPTGAGIPLSLLVTAASTTDVAIGGHLDFSSYYLKSENSVLIDTHLKPR